MNISVAQIYFIVIFGVHIYAYYLFDRIGDTYGKSEEHCGGLSVYGFKLGTMVLNTLMFICNLHSSKVIIEVIHTMCDQRKNKTISVQYKKPSGNWFGLTIGIYVCTFIIVLIAQSIIGDRISCFSNNFPSSYYHYILMICMLTIMWSINVGFLTICISICELAEDKLIETLYMSNQYKKYEHMIYYFSNKYKKINFNCKMIFASGVIILHMASIYLSSDTNNYTNNVQNYINAICWIGHFIDALNLIVLFYDDYADITIVILTFYSLINNLIIGIILALSVHHLSHRVLWSLILSNIMVGLWCGYCAVFACVWVVLCIIPCTLLSIVLICIQILWFLSDQLGCGTNAYFQDLRDGFCGVCEECVNRAIKTIDECDAFFNCVFGVGSEQITDDGCRDRSVPVSDTA